MEPGQAARPGQAGPQGPTLTKLQTVSAANQATKHIGAEGSEFVANILRSVNPPQEALKRVQETCGLSNPLCKPLLTMLDYLEVQRRDAHQHILNRSRDMLLEWIARMRATADAKAAQRGPDEPESAEELMLQEKLERLLIASFKYMGVTELKQVPIEVMNSMTRVPAAYLKQLAEEREIFNELPAAVKQQVYEYDRNLLQQDAVQYIAAYKYEVTTISTALTMHLYVRQRAALLRRQPRGASSTGTGHGASAVSCLFPPKPGAAGGPLQQRRGGGFSVANVLNAVSQGVGVGVQPPPTAPPQQQQQQRTPLRTPPRSPSAGDAGPLGLIGQGPGSGGGGKDTHGLTRKNLRTRSQAIKALVEIVGTSGKIYQHLIDLCKVRLQETASPFLGVKETSYCQLRTQLLMYLHDAEKTSVSSNKMGAGGLPKNQREVANKAREQLPGEDATYKLAWNLDAAINQRRLTVRHMRELASIMAAHLEPPPRFIEEEDDPAAAAAAAAGGGRRGLGGRLPKGGSAAGGRGGGGALAGALGRHSGAAAAAAVGAKRRRGQQGADSGRASKRGGSGTYGGYSEEVLEDSPNEYEEDDWIIKEEKKPKQQKQQQQQQQLQQPAAQGDALDAADVKGNKNEERWLGDAAMILRDPPALHLLAAELVDVLYRCLALRRLPADEPQVSWLLQLMELAVSARSCLRERAFAMPPVPVVKIKHTAEVQVRNGAQVTVELSPEEVQQAWSRGKAGTAGSDKQQQRRSSDDTDGEGHGGDVLLPPGKAQGRKGYDWHKRTRQGREYEIWFTDHDQLTEVWPEVLAVLAEGEMLAQPWQQDPADADVAPLSPAGWRVVVGAYAGYEAVRQVIQMLVLDRLTGGDLVTAYRLLRVITASAHLSTPGADLEYAPFGFSLVGILHELVLRNRLSATSKFWRVAFEGVLLRVVDAEQSRKDARVHKAMLDLLKSVAKQLTPEVLAGYLGTMLEATADTRTRLQDRQEEFSRMQVSHTGASLDTIPGYVNFSSTHHDWSDGFRLVRKEKYGTMSDGLSGDYKQLLAVGGLTGKEGLWPEALREYMQAAEGRQQADDASRRAERAAQQAAEVETMEADDEDEPYDPTADLEDEEEQF